MSTKSDALRKMYDRLPMCQQGTACTARLRFPLKNISCPPRCSKARAVIREHLKLSAKVLGVSGPPPYLIHYIIGTECSKCGTTDTHNFTEVPEGTEVGKPLVGHDGGRWHCLECHSEDNLVGWIHALYQVKPGQKECSACGGTGQDDPPPGKYHGLCKECRGTGQVKPGQKNPHIGSDFDDFLKEEGIGPPTTGSDGSKLRDDYTV